MGSPERYLKTSKKIPKAPQPEGPGTSGSFLSAPLPGGRAPGPDGSRADHGEVTRAERRGAKGRGLGRWCSWFCLRCFFFFFCGGGALLKYLLGNILKTNLGFSSKSKFSLLFFWLRRIGGKRRMGKERRI